MKYWLTDNPDAEPDENTEFSFTIPSRANAGTYYIWYKVIDDENHSDTKPQRVKNEISPCDLTITDQTITYNVSDTVIVTLAVYCCSIGVCA